MRPQDRPTRRTFLMSAAATTAASQLAAVAGAGTATPAAEFGPNDRVRIATIGMGIIGFIDTACALRVPGVELVAISDLYAGRRTHAKEVHGDRVDAHVDYREVLARKDVDAVLLCVPDHWHARMSIDAMKAGKAVYCEKPMVRSVAEGPDVIRVQKETKAVFQVGSQFASSIVMDKLKEALSSGVIGKLHSVNARYNRNSAMGAWQYSIPTDASPETVDWDRFLGEAPKRPFDADRFFRWRKYWDYGTAVAGDLFVHLLTGIHHATGALGPTRVAAMGGQRVLERRPRGLRPDPGPARLSRDRGPPGLHAGPSDRLRGWRRRELALPLRRQRRRDRRDVPRPQGQQGRHRARDPGAGAQGIQLRGDVLEGTAGRVCGQAGEGDARRLAVGVAREARNVPGAARLRRAVRSLRQVLPLDPRRRTRWKKTPPSATARRSRRSCATTATGRGR